ncbi:hypothetical protein [Salipaludibacillus daqingensis]|uniref:hypothetical protein n=1 Tax=Salipaludibacillus daqingensis TaxID=3041001 RepID=UPI0024754EE3|nr:hypothetical protein [Salipaludibacillus daqingensis]
MFELMSYILQMFEKGGMDLDLLIFFISYILLSVLTGLFYIGVLLLFIWTIKKIFNMNETKWNALFRFRENKGVYVVFIFPYLLTIVMMIPLIIVWFDMITFEYSVISSISIVMLLTISGIVKFSKLNDIVQDKLS